MSDHHFGRRAVSLEANRYSLHAALLGLQAPGVPQSVRRLYRFEYAGDPNQRSVTAADDALSRTEEAIHQVRVFAAARRQAYEALTVEAQFDKVVQLSGVMKVASGWQEHYWDPLAKLLV